MMNPQADPGALDELIMLLIATITDAFWQIPLRLEKQRFYCATAILKGKRNKLAFLRTVQGSSNAPTLWGRLTALIMRLTQAL